MKKTKKKKRRLRVGRLILLLLIIGAISFSCYNFIDVPIRSIEVTGHEILSDSEIIKAASLDKDPSFFSVISMLVKNKLKENPYIKDAAFIISESDNISFPVTSILLIGTSIKL